MNDYARMGLSLTMHPLALIRPELKRRRVVAARATNDEQLNGRKMRCAGLVTVRQHPGTAKGVTFVTLEDETGQVNVVVWKSLAEEQHRVLLESSVMAVDGHLAGQRRRVPSGRRTAARLQPSAAENPLRIARFPLTCASAENAEHRTA